MPSQFDTLVDDLSRLTQRRSAEHQRARLAKSFQAYPHHRNERTMGDMKRELETLHKSFMAREQRQREADVERLRATIRRGREILRKAIGRLPADEIARLEARLNRVSASVGL